MPVELIAFMIKINFKIILTTPAYPYFTKEKMNRYNGFIACSKHGHELQKVKHDQTRAESLLFETIFFIMSRKFV